MGAGGPWIIALCDHGEGGGGAGGPRIIYRISWVPTIVLGSYHWVPITGFLLLGSKYGLGHGHQEQRGGMVLCVSCVARNSESYGPRMNQKKSVSPRLYRLYRLRELVELIILDGGSVQRRRVALRSPISASFQLHKLSQGLGPSSHK